MIDQTEVATAIAEVFLTQPKDMAWEDRSDQLAAAVMPFFSTSAAMAPPPAALNAPDRLWLIMGTHGPRIWTFERETIWPGDEGVEPVEFVRATVAPETDAGERSGDWVAANLVGSAKSAEQMLGELLARIHRDGGQYIQRHGLAKAVADADPIIAALHSEMPDTPAARWRENGEPDPHRARYHCPPRALGYGPSVR